MKAHALLFVPFAAACLAAVPAPLEAQAVPVASVTPAVVAPATSVPDFVYQRPTEQTNLRTYASATFGPFPILVAFGEAGVDQFDNAPPEWNQGVSGYSKRLGSDFGMEAVSTTTRYALAEALREDTRYFPCACSGLFPRFGHAVFSTLTARHGDEGHRIFSIPALVAPYAGSNTAVFGWYPSRYGAKDALRIGNYNLLGEVGSSLWLEFLYRGPHTLFGRLHPVNSAAP